MFENWWG